MKIVCINGHTNDGNAKFCRYCGTAVQNAQVWGVIGEPATSSSRPRAVVALLVVIGIIAVITIGTVMNSVSATFNQTANILSTTR